jgi:hypothetical protein
MKGDIMKGYTVRVPIEVIQATSKIVDMFIYDETKHFEECSKEEQEKHIYNELELVNRFIHSQELHSEIDIGEQWLLELEDMKQTEAKRK